MKYFFFLFFLYPCNSGAQVDVQLIEIAPNPNALKKLSFFRTIKSTLPLQQTAIEFGDTLTLNRYYKQRYLITDTSKIDAVWFTMLMGYDGNDFWLVADTDYDNEFSDEKPCKVKVPGSYAQLRTGQRIGGELLRFDLNGFSLGDLNWHPEFPLFLRPDFSFLTEARDKDSLVINTELIAGHKAAGNLIIDGEEMQLAIQLHALMADFSLFEYYNPKHQQMCMLNLMELVDNEPGKLIAFLEAYSFLLMKKPMLIEEKKISLMPLKIDYPNKSFKVGFLPFQQIAVENKIAACKVSAAINLQSKKTFKLPPNDSAIFYFTGSWCAPCRVVTPKVEVFFSNLPKGWKGYVVAIEKSMENAIKYLDGCSFANRLFEPITDRTECSLKQLLSNRLYPSFAFLSPQGKLLWQGISLNEGESLSMPPLAY